MTDGYRDTLVDEESSTADVIDLGVIMAAPLKVKARFSAV